MKKILNIACAIMLTGQLSHAMPMFNEPKSGFSDWLQGRGSASLGLVDPSRLSVNHTLSVGASFGSGSSLMQSLYASHFTYRLSNPVTLGFILGASNLRYGGSGPAMSATSLLTGVSLDWRPYDNVLFHFEMLQAPRISGLGYTGGVGVK